MKDSSFYFRHDYNARNDHKTSALISDHGAAGYGIYWCLIEMLHEEPSHKLPLQDFFYRACAKQTSTSVEQVLNTIKDCLNTYRLFESESGFFFSERVFRNVQERADIREKRSMAGKISAEKRKYSTGAEQVLNKTQQRKGKERKEENNNTIPAGAPAPNKYEAFLKAFNDLTGRSFKTIDSKTKTQFDKLKKGGYQYQEFLTAITNGLEDSKTWPKPQLFTPEYITRETNFAKYLNWKAIPAAEPVKEPRAFNSQQEYMDYWGGTTTTEILKPQPQL